MGAFLKKIFWGMFLFKAHNLVSNLCHLIVIILSEIFNLLLKLSLVIFLLFFIFYKKLDIYVLMYIECMYTFRFGRNFVMTCIEKYMYMFNNLDFTGTF